MHFHSIFTLSHLLLLSMLVSSALAVFYTRSSDTKYPRLGRRSFYTSRNTKHYPRIGRSGGSNSASSAHEGVIKDFTSAPSGVTSEHSDRPSPVSSVVSGAAAEAFPELAKRGVFTQGSGYPRVGKRADSEGDSSTTISDYIPILRAQILKGLAELNGERPRMSSLNEKRDDEIEDGGNFGVADIDSAKNDGQGESPTSFPPEFLFLMFDSNGDDSLSEQEFTSGMRRFEREYPIF